MTANAMELGDTTDLCYIKDKTMRARVRTELPAAMRANCGSYCFIA
jgi:hypothetical protein